jgi:hypothetical protein
MTAEPRVQTAKEATTVGADLVRAVGQVVAALAAGIGVIYVLGGLVVWLRLRLVSEPQLAVVSGLPREVLISVGLVVVGLALGVGAIYALRRLVRRAEDERPPPTDADLRSLLKHDRWHVAGLGALLALPTLLAVIFAWRWDESWLGTAWTGRWYGFSLTVLLVWLVGCVWALVATRLWRWFGARHWALATKTVQDQQEKVREASERANRAREAAEKASAAAMKAEEDANKAAADADEVNEMGKKQELERAAAESERAGRERRRADRVEEDARQAEELAQALQVDYAEPVEGARAQKLAIEGFNKPSAIGVSALFWAALWVPAFVAATASLPLTKAQACGTDPSPDVEGEFIGQTADRVFLTDASTDRIVSLSLDDYGRVYVGDAAWGACPTAES